MVIDNPERPGNNAAGAEPPELAPDRDFTTAIVHLYRGEISRANAWRNRLDVTTNWALVATGAALTFAFGEANSHHSVILLDLLLVTLFLFTEARSYRYLDLWSYRVRLIESNFYGTMLLSGLHPAADWQTRLGQSMVRPRFMITIWEALGRRLRRNYAWIYFVLELAWFAKLLLMPGNTLTTDELLRRSRMGLIPGWAVMVGLLIFNLLLLWLSIYTLRLTQASTEVEPYTRIKRR